MPGPATAAERELAELTVAEVRTLLEIALPLPAHSPALHQAWSQWRRYKRQQSRRSYWNQSQGAAAVPATAGRAGRKCYLRLYY